MTTIGSDQALISSADEVVKEAKRLVPVRTGMLRAGIARSDPRMGRTGERMIAVGIKPPVSRRAHFTEFGTVRSAAQPFLRPAMDGKSLSNINLMGRILNRFMEAFAGGSRAAPTTKLNIKVG